VLEEEARAWVDAQVEKFEAMPPQEPGELFAYMYAEPTPIIREQEAALLEEVQG
jgi:TPP-dependent pyruvate/acetoin dehydrogenase alpha subunit